ncbi:MAG: excinuclease ABC subunit B, partial [Clostridia bacterium]|nr:excinuclease ABC subunit B [Clostridia bacterium]
NAIEETNRRREYQQAYNKANNITPMTIKKDVVNTLMISKKTSKNPELESMSRSEIVREVEHLTGLMSVASSSLDFETCIKLRDEITLLKKKLKEKPAGR